MKRTFIELTMLSENKIKLRVDDIIAIQRYNSGKISYTLVELINNNIYEIVETPEEIEKVIDNNKFYFS